MAVTFNPTPTTDRDHLRVHIGDTIYDDGPAPNRANLSDEILDYFLEAGGGVAGAVPLAFDHLAALWISRPIFGPGDLSTTHVDMYRKYHQAAADWRARFALDGDGELTGDASYSPIGHAVFGVNCLTGLPYARGTE